MLMNEDIVAIVVAYNSGTSRLNTLLSILADQCTVLVVDNSTDLALRENIRLITERVGVVWLPLNGNLGIAHAQNIGIAWAREHGAVDILLMDDDSVPSQTLVIDLFSARKLSSIHPVIVGARTLNDDLKDISNRAPGNAIGLTPCSELTSSGTLIPMKVFDQVGGFDECLFIDCVDFEWGWRAQSLGIPLMLCDEVAIQHRLGEGARFGFKVANPIRHYYQFRNVLKMIFHSKAPLRWRISQSVKLPVKFILIAVLPDHKIIRLRYALYGIRDFLFDRFGKFDR